MENTHERFIPTMSGPYEIRVNIERYLKVMPHIEGKTVLELGCGTGLGTYLYSLVAKKIYALDYDAEAVTCTDSFPFDPRKVQIFQHDLRQGVPHGSFDVVVAVEILEHLDDPGALLAKLEVPRLVFSLPLNSLAISTWHRYPIRKGESGMQDIRDLLGKHWTIEQMELQDQHWVFGVATRKGLER